MILKFPVFSCSTSFDKVTWNLQTERGLIKLPTVFIRNLFCSLATVLLSGCYRYGAPLLEEHVRNFSKKASDIPCATLVEMKEHSSFSMRLLGACLEKGWGEQHPVFVEALDAYTRAARCGDPEALAWLKAQGETLPEGAQPFVIVEQKIEGGKVSVKELDPKAPADCRLVLERTGWWYVWKPVDFLIHIPVLPICAVGDVLCPKVSEMPPEYYQKPSGYMGKFYRSGVNQ